MRTRGLKCNLPRVAIPKESAFHSLLANCCFFYIRQKKTARTNSIYEKNVDKQNMNLFIYAYYNRGYLFQLKVN